MEHDIPVVDIAPFLAGADGTEAAEDDGDEPDVRARGRRILAKRITGD